MDCRLCSECKTTTKRAAGIVGAEISLWDYVIGMETRIQNQNTGTTHISSEKVWNTEKLKRKMRSRTNVVCKPV